MIQNTFRRTFGCNLERPELFFPTFLEACDSVAKDEQWQTLRQLLISYSLPQEVNSKNEQGETMLTLAAAQNCHHVVRVLCQIKGNPYIENAKGWSAIHVAALEGQTDVLSVFLELGFDLDHGDSRLGYTPLHLAVSVDKLETVRFLRKSEKADFMKRANQGLTVLHVAASCDSSRCAQFLFDHYPMLKAVEDEVLQETPTHKAARHQNLTMYSYLCHRGSPNDTENIEEDTADDLVQFRSRYYY